MRIISGIYKSRKIKTPPNGSEIRPSKDSTRETVFNILSNYISFEKFICIDLFAGTGSYGIECLSRGARMCYFVDKSINILKENISLLNINDIAVIKRMDAVKFLQVFENNKNKYLVFADPPYEFNKYENLIRNVSNLNSIFVLEHSNKFDNENLDIKPFIFKKIGFTRISIYNFLKKINQ